MKHILPLITAVMLILTACESEEEKRAKEARQQAQQAQEQLQQGLQQLEDLTQRQTDGKPVEPVNFRELKALLPGSIAGMSQHDAEGQTTGAMGFTVSQAGAAYGEGDRRIKLEITDAGGISMAAMSLAAWSMTTIDRETDEGFERTGTIGGHKSYEEYATANRSGQVSVLVGGRFIVSAQGDGVSIDELREAVQGVNLGQLAGMGK
ncbi:MAG: hypothetical protein SF053_03610 [Bacteroidia bacterium]|nr:hypothetical protein [Bacteroidia bacterium]